MFIGTSIKAYSATSSTYLSENGNCVLSDYSEQLPHQRLVTAGGEDDHQHHSKTLKHRTSSMDDGTPNMPDIPTLFIKSRHDDGPTSSKLLPEFNPDDLI